MYDLELEKSNYIHNVCSGNFTKPRANEVVQIRGTDTIELVGLDIKAKKQTANVICVQKCFCVIRSVCSLRLREFGGKIDYLCLGSDTGKMSILQFNRDKWLFEEVCSLTYGKTGCRRIVPGEYCASDPLGRAIMIGSLEKSKLVFPCDKDEISGTLQLCSPLEANLSSHLTLSIVGIDGDYENNPIFACLERCFERADSDPTSDPLCINKVVAFYEYDMSIKHVLRRCEIQCFATAFFLLTVPQFFRDFKKDKEEPIVIGPGGVFVAHPIWQTSSDVFGYGTSGSLWTS